MLIVTGCPKGHEVRPTRSPELYNCPYCGVCYNKDQTKPLLVHDNKEFVNQS
jgi:hypothetical protein